MAYLISFSGFAQKKKDLLAQIATLENTITALNDSVSIAKRAVNVSNSKAELAEKENAELRDANATLLQNLTNFSKISKKTPGKLPLKYTTEGQLTRWNTLTERIC